MVNFIKVIKLIKKMYVYKLIFLFKNISLVLIYKFIYFFFIESKIYKYFYKYIFDSKAKILKKKNIYKNKKLWIFLNTVLYFKVLNSKYYLEFRTKTKSGGFYLYENAEGKQKYKNFTNLVDYNFYNNVKEYNWFKSFNLPSNLLKKKLVKKKYWYLWKFKDIKNLRFNRIIIWPLFITIKPQTIILKNIYFKNYFILTKINNKLSLKTFFFPGNNIKLGNFIWYKINKYFYLKYNSKYNINQIIKNYKIYKLNFKNYIITNYFKASLDKKYFYRMQAIYLNLKNYSYLGNLFYKKIYNLYFFWFIFYYNKLLFYYNRTLFNIWLRFYNINYYLKFKILYSFLLLYEKRCFNININFNYLIWDNVYLNYNHFFKFLTKFKYKNDYNLFDFYLKNDFYIFKDFYKLDYFIKIKKIVDFKHLDSLPNKNNIMFLN